MPLPASRPVRRSQRGFTLMELMITVVVIGVLAAVAYPSYIDSVRKGRRSDAMQALATVQQAQERWRANNTTYTGTLANAGNPSSTYYTIAIPYSGASGYVVTATAKTGTSQANDTGCTTLTVAVNMNADGTANAGVTSNLPTSCWRK